MYARSFVMYAPTVLWIIIQYLNHLFIATFAGTFPGILSLLSHRWSMKDRSTAAMKIIYLEILHCVFYYFFTMTTLGVLLHQCDGQTRDLFRKYERSRIKLNHQITSREFNKMCLKERLLPKYIKLLIMHFWLKYVAKVY